MVDKRYLESNQKTWNTWTPLHYQSDFYDVEGFKSGRNTLVGPELSELSNVNGQSMLHLQCHFGLDTLNWERLGALPTGVDFSSVSIDTAKKLAKELNMQSRFICSDVYELKESINEKFDIVFTSYGVLFWLSDLAAWAEIIHYFLKPGGIFYIIEFHPFIDMFDDDFKELEYGYFEHNDPLKFHKKGTYAVPKADIESPEYGWQHSLSEITNSLINTGLHIQFLHEFNYSSYPVFQRATEVKPRQFVHPAHSTRIPYMFSILARKS